MSVHFTLSLYWLLLPLALGLCWWVFADREDEHGFLGGIEILFRLPVAIGIFLLVLCIMLVINLFLK